MGFNPGGAVGEAGQDAIVASTRVRASNSPITFTDSSGSVTLAASPLGVNYIDGVGTPITVSSGAGAGQFSSGGASVTIPANNLLTGVVVCRPASSGNSITTDSAFNIQAACQATAPSGVQVGDYLSVLIMNDSAVPMTVIMGSSVTSANSNTSSIAANTSRYCLLRFTTVSTTPAMTMYF
jgi:hypothetical protein